MQLYNVCPYIFSPLPYHPLSSCQIFLPPISAPTGSHYWGLVTTWAQPLITSNYYLPSMSIDRSTMKLFGHRLHGKHFIVFLSMRRRIIRQFYHVWHYFFFYHLMPEMIKALRCRRYQTWMSNCQKPSLYLLHHGHSGGQTLIVNSDQYLLLVSTIRLAALNKWYLTWRRKLY